MHRLKEQAETRAARISELEQENADLREQLAEAGDSDMRHVRAMAACAGLMHHKRNKAHRALVSDLRMQLAEAKRARNKSQVRIASLEADLEHLAAMYAAAIERAEALRECLAEADSDINELCGRCATAEQDLGDVLVSEVPSVHDTFAAQLEDARAHCEAQEHDMLQLVEELDRVSWYQEAYEERCEQVRLLAQMAKLAEDREAALARVNSELLAQGMSPRSKSRVAELSGNMNQLIAMRLERAELAHRITRLEQELATYRTVGPNGARTRGVGAM